MAKLKPYEEYREVDLPWLEKVPSHWGQRKIKYLFNERIEKGYPNETLLAATQAKGVIPKYMYENRTVVAQKDLHLLKFVKKGDFVISLRSFQGGIEYAYYQGIISPAYTIMIPKSEIISGFFKYLGKSELFIELLKMCVTGIREGQNIDYFLLKNSIIPLPPKKEQDQIAKFLDNRLSKINRFIKAKKKQVELLKEQKQAIINQAVMKGIDPNVPMKDSGVEWIGEIPKHWEVVRLKYLSRSPLLYGANESGTEFSKNLPRYIRITDITIDGELKEKNKLSLPIEKAKSFILSDGDILFARSGATVGKTFLYSKKYGECCFAGYMIKCSPNKELILHKFLYNFTLSGVYKLWLQHVFIQSTIQNISAEKYKELLISVAPLQEQMSIVTFIELKTKTIDKAIDAIQKQIDLVKEYRTSLISEVVTGKVDVRDIAVEDIEELEEEEEEVFEEEIEDEEV